MPNGNDTENFVRIEEEHTVQSFLTKHPYNSANKVMRWWQLVWYCFVALIIVVLFLRNDIPIGGYHIYFSHMIELFCMFYIVVILLKLVSISMSIAKDSQVRVTPEETAELSDDELPVYTILVPLFHEKDVASKIVHAIEQMDYPQEKLDIKLLLEPDDEETRSVLRNIDLPSCFELIIVPHSLPRTKPKACNHGLARAKGKYLVIFDAEDRPEPDQLRKAVAGFKKVGEQTVCLQAKLNYFNPRQNWLTRFFTVEYSTWFDLYLPGLHTLGWPIPLGGTSNHFKTSVLKEIGGWDPFNVTEDCDLGIRLHRMGHKTEILDSTTWEEANSQLGNWIRQRSRWIKGYIQTHLVYMRHPLETIRRLGLWGTFGFLTSVGGLALMLLLNPLFWTIGITYLVLLGLDLVAMRGDLSAFWSLSVEQRLSWKMIYVDASGDPISNVASVVFYVITLALLLGNLVFIAISVFACRRRRMHDLIPYALLSPAYWVLISIGAWKGALQLISRPFYWEKTRHGLITTPEDEQSP